MSFPNFADHFVNAVHGAQKAKTYEHQMQAQAVAMGSLDEDQVTNTLALAVANRKSGQENEKQKERTSQQFLFLSLLQDMQQRLDELDVSLAVRRESLSAKYGENVIQGMVDTFLIDEDTTGLKTKKDKMEALAKKFLNPDGTVKDEYKHLEEALYVKDWLEAEELRPVVAKYEGRNDLTILEQREIYDKAKELPNVDAENLRQVSTNLAVKDAAAQVVDENRVKVEEQSATALQFGSPS